MPAENHSWTISETGTSEGPMGGDDCCVDGQINFVPNMGTARQDVPYEHDFHSRADVNPAPDRVDVPDPVLSGGIPDPGGSESGTPLDFGAVAPDTDRGVSYDIEGVSGSGYGGFALGNGRPD